VDSSIKVIAVGANNPDWDLEVLKQAGRLIDYLSIHQYYGRDDYEGTVAGAVAAERRLKLLSSVIEVAEGMLQVDRPIEIAFDEWNIWYRGRTRPWEEFYALKDGLFAAGVFHAMYRLCHRVTMANLAQMVNALGMLHTTSEGLVKSPIYHVFDLYSNHTGRLVLDAALEPEDASARETFSADVSVHVVGRPAPPARIIRGVPYVDVVATLDLGGTGASDARRLSVAAINRHRTQEAQLRLALELFRPWQPQAVDVYQLAGDDPFVQNTPERPDAVTPTSRRLAETPPVLTLSPCSLTIFEWSLPSR